MSPMLRRIIRDRRRVEFIDTCKVMILAALISILSIQLGELYLWFTGFYR